MKILVTGGTGFLGKNICKRLVKINHNLIVLSRKKNINKLKK